VDQPLLEETININSGTYDKETIVMKMIVIAFKCTQTKFVDSPSMKKKQIHVHVKQLNSSSKTIMFL